jgi:ATP:ADP antiporter, AAA family
MTARITTARAKLASLIDVHPAERTALALSFLTFFCVLASYFTVRPLRETMGTTLGKGALEQLFTVVFFVMLALVPLFGYLATRLPRRQVLPAIYGFFILNLIGFAIAMRGGPASPTLAATFFVWVSVYNLFIVSLFWSLMSDRWTSDQGKRLFGIIAAGGTTGALVGPYVAWKLVGIIGPANLPLVSAAFLVAALAACIAVDRAQAATPNAKAETKPPATLAAIIDGATRVFQSPYLGRIALWIFLANLVSTFFYLEQSRLVRATIPDEVARVKFFASYDLRVAEATVAIQLLGTAAILTRFGLTLALVALPAMCIAGLLAIGAVPTLAIVAGVMASERIVTFALSVPAMRVLYTVVEPDEKYKAQNFIDTVVYRGGDAASGWMLGAFKAFEMSNAMMIALTLPFAAIWLYASLGLGQLHGEKAKTHAKP